jgi:hypothetical protein
MQIPLQEVSMKSATLTARRFVFAGALFLFFLATATLAGPPLICHSFDIGDAKSLPWISHDWNLSGGESYDTSKLARDTIAILDSSQVTLVHMETLRRATLYAKKDRLAAKELIIRLIARAEGTKSASPSQPSALAIFDAGYLTEAYKQWLGEQNNPAQKFDGFALVQLALQRRGSDPQMEFAAALIAVGKPGIDAQDHAQKAIAGAKDDPLLDRNLSARFLGAQSDTLSAMISRSKAATKMAKE